MSRKLTILGAGAWGTALAFTALRAGTSVCIWARDSTKLKAINAPVSLRTSSLQEATDWGEQVIYALPAQTVRSFWKTYRPSQTTIFACKGVEFGTGKLISEVLEDQGILTSIAFLGGPHLAAEVAQGLPTSGTLAASTLQEAQRLSTYLAHEDFHLTPSTDCVGLQIMGAFKNVFAIGSGLLMGSALGENARAAFLTQGFSEMIAFGRA